MSSEPDQASPRSAAQESATRRIFLSLFVVGVCWVLLRFGSLIVSIAVTHIWDKNDPILSAYAFMFRQLTMTFIYPSVISVFRPAFIPLYNEIKERESKEQAVVFARGILQIGLLLGLLVFGILWLFPEATVGIMAPEFTSAQHAASVTMMRQMAPGVLFLLCAEMYLIQYHAEKKFAYPHGAEAVQKIGWGIGIVVMATLLNWNRLAVGLSYSIACLAQLTVNIVGMKRTFGWVFRYSPMVPWFRKWGKRVGLLALPLVVGIVAARFRDLLTLRLQSQLEIVRFNGVEFARQLTNLPVAFLGQIVSIVMLPHLAAILHSDGRAAHRQTVESSIEMLTLLSIPVVAAVLVLAPEMMSLLFIEAHWGPDDFVFCREGALAARVMAVGFTFLILENILLPGLYSIQSMWWPILWGLAASGFQVLCLIGLANADLGGNSSLLVAGVAFVYPLSRILKNGTLILVLRRRIGLFPGRTFAVLVAKMLLLFAGTVAVAYFARQAIHPILGDIRVDADLPTYKGLLVLQIGVPGAAMGLGFVLLVLLAGYRKQGLQLVSTLLNRGDGRPAARKSD